MLQRVRREWTGRGVALGRDKRAATHNVFVLRQGEPYVYSV